MEREKQQEESEITGQNEEVKVMGPKELLVNRDVERLQVIEAEIQKKLTKAAGYFAGQLVRELGLRYAPEIRFFRDNTLELYKTYEE